MASNSNRGVVYLKPGHVEVQKIDFPTFRSPAGKTIDHGVILKVVTTNICGSDQHMVRGHTTAPAGMVLGRRKFTACRCIRKTECTHTAAFTQLHQKIGALSLEPLRPS
jgi:hypothetical protein